MWTLILFLFIDMPSILSGGRLGVIDPIQKYFKSSTHSFNFANDRELIDTYPHQFEPFCGLFDCDTDTFRNGHYSGTVFRFPLRTTASTVSDTLYTTEKVENLFSSFKAESHLIILFLKYLECIKVYRRDDKSKGPVLLYEVKLADDCLEEVRGKRSEFLNKTKANQWLDKPLVATYPVTLEQISYDEGEAHTERYRWLVTNYFCGGHGSVNFRRLHRDTELRCTPWVGVAMPLDIDGTLNTSELSEEDGHVFCFLPLSLERKTPTGLPVHVNGFFALEQNRKYLKWPGTDSRLREDLLDKRIQWNLCMLKEALPKAYVHLLMSAIRRHQRTDDLSISSDVIYRAFPDFSKVDKKWEIILLPLYADLFNLPAIFTEAKGGQWVEPRYAVYDQLDCDPETREIIIKLLTENSINVAKIPAHVMDAMNKCCRLHMRKITANLVNSSLKEIQDNFSQSWDSKIRLLKYLLKQNKYELLDGLQLLPLANGGFAHFCTNPRKAPKFIYIGTPDHPRNLLPGLDDDFLDEEIDADIRDMLNLAVKKGITQL